MKTRTKIAIICLSIASVFKPADAGMIEEPPDFAGAYFSSPATNLGTLSEDTTIEGSVPVGDVDAVVFTAAGTISGITVFASGGTSGSFEISLGTGTNPKFGPEGGGDIFFNPKLEAPGNWTLLGSPLAPGTYYLGITDGHSTTIDFRVEIELAPAQPAPPPVEIEVVDGVVTLSWPSRATGWRLYQSPDLRSWARVEETVIIDGAVNRVELAISPTQGSGFFRLQVPSG